VRLELGLHGDRSLEVSHYHVRLTGERLALFSAGASENHHLIEVAHEPSEVVGPLSDHAFRRDDEREVGLVTRNEYVERKDEGHGLAGTLLVEDTKPEAIGRRHGGDIHPLVIIENLEALLAGKAALGFDAASGQHGPDVREDAGAHLANPAAVLGEDPRLRLPPHSQPRRVPCQQARRFGRGDGKPRRGALELCQP